MMRSRVFRGSTTHVRIEPARHAFTYRLRWLGIDLDEPQDLDRRMIGFGYDRRRPVSVRDRDYGGPGPGTMRDRVHALLRAGGVDPDPLRITLMTMPRIMGYVFNPVNFYVARDARGAVRALLAEVRNTFGEMHHYVGVPEEDPHPDRPCSFRFEKTFYVSPFIEVQGTYLVRIRCTDDEFSASISLEQEGRTMFTATMDGTGCEPRAGSACLLFLAMPWSVVSVMTKIQWHALRLRFGRGLRTVVKPRPEGPGTVPASTSSVWYWIRDRFVRYASRPPKESRKSAPDSTKSP